MTERISIKKEEVYAGNFSKEKKYTVEYLNFSETVVNLSSLDLDIIVNSGLYLFGMKNLIYISKKVVLVGEKIIVGNCPLLKTLPTELIKNKYLTFEKNQLHTTILSKKQFLSLKEFFISERTYWSKAREIKTYEEYYSLIEPTLIKNNLLNVCSL